MKDFENIYIALRDTLAGSVGAKTIFQMNIGTTLRGRATKFKLWYNKISNNKVENIKIYKWPVFQQALFNPSKSILQQTHLTPIVNWHDVNILESKRIENLPRFLEEYMCETVDDENVFYDFDLIMNCIDPDLIQLLKPEGGLFYIGVDVASVHDYFVISIFEKIKDEFFQRYLWYSNKVQLPTAQKKLEQIITLFKPQKVRIDSVGIGLQLTQAMIMKFGANIIEGVKGNESIKGFRKGAAMKLNEYLHTNQKVLMLNNKLHLLNDELQITHYSMWNHEFKAESNSEQGHGDIAVANGYALLPMYYKISKAVARLESNIQNNIVDEEVKPVKAKYDWGEFA